MPTFWFWFALQKSMAVLVLVALWRYLGEPMLLGLRSRHWTPVQARVTRSGIRESRLAALIRRNSQVPDVAYGYEVGGRRFHGDRHPFLEIPSWDAPFATRLAAQYPVGSTVQVFVDPKRPERSVISRNVGTFDVVCFVLLALMVLFFAFIGEILTLVLPR